MDFVKSTSLLGLESIHIAYDVIIHSPNPFILKFGYLDREAVIEQMKVLLQDQFVIKESLKNEYYYDS